jgi:flagellar hook assembly protein FlgD
VTVHDAAGRSLRALADGDRSVGRHFATWDGADASGRPVASGVYFVRMESNGGATETRRIVRLR